VECCPRGGGRAGQGAGAAGPTATGGPGGRGAAASAQMGADLEAAWHHPAATAVTHKRLIRAVMREAVARVEDDQIQLLLHWQGGSVSLVIPSSYGYDGDAA
jgi:hypothetical protein